VGSSPVKTCSIPTLRGRSPQHGRTSKGGGGPTPCSPRRVRNEPESGRRGAAPLPCFLLLPSALPRLPTPHAASRRPTGTPAQFPLGLLRLPGVTGPRRLRSGHGLPVAPPPWCGGAASGERLNSWYFHGSCMHARTHANVHLGCLCSPGPSPLRRKLGCSAL